MGSLVKKTCSVPLCVETANSWPSSVQFSWSRPGGAAGGADEGDGVDGAFDSRLRRRTGLTFSLIVQLDHIADIFELGQLVDLYAARRNRFFFSLLEVN